MHLSENEGIEGNVFVVTGGAGFVGSALCLELVRRGAREVRSFDLRFSSPWANLFKDKGVISIQGPISLSQTISSHVRSIHPSIDRSILLLNESLGFWISVFLSLFASLLLWASLFLFYFIIIISLNSIFFYFYFYYSIVWRWIRAWILSPFPQFVCYGVSSSSSPNFFPSLSCIF